eukprot:3150140-Rhodomonas_salina.1
MDYCLLLALSAPVPLPWRVCLQSPTVPEVYSRSVTPPPQRCSCRGRFDGRDARQSASLRRA